MSEPSRDDLLATVDSQARALAHARAELRRSFEELDWAQEQIRVLRRLVCKLASKGDE